MDRLTWEYIEGGFYVDGTEISPSDFEGHTVYYGPAVDRLAAYEASGKSPEEVAQVFAENARLAKELQGAKANGMIQEHIISSGHNPQDRDTIVRVIMENSALSAENARLRAERDKAGELINGIDCELFFLADTVKRGSDQGRVIWVMMDLIERWRGTEGKA